MPNFIRAALLLMASLVATVCTREHHDVVAAGVHVVGSQAMCGTCSLAVVVLLQAH